MCLEATSNNTFMLKNRRGSFNVKENLCTVELAATDHRVPCQESCSHIVLCWLMKDGLLVHCFQNQGDFRL